MIKFKSKKGSLFLGTFGVVTGIFVYSMLSDKFTWPFSFLLFLPPCLLAWNYFSTYYLIENGKLKANYQEPLEDCLMKDGYVNFDFNSQGLPTSKSKNQNYKQGKNINFWYPRDGKVARFIVSSDIANLNCYYTDPDVSYVSLGVFPCAEGAMKKSGGLK